MDCTLSVLCFFINDILIPVLFFCTHTCFIVVWQNGQNSPRHDTVFPLVRNAITFVLTLCSVFRVYLPQPSCARRWGGRFSSLPQAASNVSKRTCTTHIANARVDRNPGQKYKEGSKQRQHERTVRSQLEQTGRSTQRLLTK